MFGYGKEPRRKTNPAIVKRVLQDDLKKLDVPIYPISDINIPEDKLEVLFDEVRRRCQHLKELKRDCEIHAKSAEDTYNYDLENLYRKNHRLATIQLKLQYGFLLSITQKLYLTIKGMGKSNKITRKVWRKDDNSKKRTRGNIAKPMFTDKPKRNMRSDKLDIRNVEITVPNCTSIFKIDLDTLPVGDFPRLLQNMDKSWESLEDFIQNKCIPFMKIAFKENCEDKHYYFWKKMEEAKFYQDYLIKYKERVWYKYERAQLVRFEVPSIKYFYGFYLYLMTPERASNYRDQAQEVLNNLGELKSRVQECMEEAREKEYRDNLEYYQSILEEIVFKEEKLNAFITLLQDRIEPGYFGKGGDYILNEAKRIFNSIDNIGYKFKL